MIFKKKILKLKLFSLLILYFKRFIFSLGILTFSFILLSGTYYYSSGLQKNYTPSAMILQINDKIFKKYIGFDLTNSSDYLKIIRLNLISSITSNKLETVYLEVNQESILGLELQRKLRSQQGGELSDEEKNYLPARIKLDNGKYDIKIRTKGVRKIHWINKNGTSYKVDIRGDKRLWGMEEFSLQKPITRNYTYEYLFHNLLGHVGLVNIKYFFVNLYLNDQNLGVYAVEESFSKEIVERQKKRNGPIFSLKDELGEYFPNVKYELYSENFWVSQHPQLIKDLFSILNNLKSQKFEINNHFDIDKWAKYFAIMDLTGAYHGSLLKSVKLFYNPTSALFEPIGYDLHKGAGIFDNFILIDFLQEETRGSKIACSFICYHKDWYMKFLKLDNGEINFKFVKKYTDYLIEYSKDDFIKNFISLHEEDLSKYNKAIYKDNSKTDKVRWTGAGFFVYDKNYLFSRANLIRNRINSTDIKNVDVSKSNKKFYFEDYEISNFPFLAKTMDCKDKSDEKKYFFAGKMSIDLETSCKKIKITSFKNEDKFFELKENITITPNQNIFFKNNFDNLNENLSFLKVSENVYKAVSQVNISKNTIINSNEKFIFERNIPINIINGSTLFIEGNVEFINDENNLTQIYSEDSSGSIILSGNRFNLKNLTFNGLSKPNLTGYILYGGINFINSNIILNNIYINDSKEEDAVNIINSKSKVSNIFFENIKADAFDIDFGQLSFNNIHCKNINNDCLDISGAEVDGQNFFSENTLDKGISVGENSRVNITNLETLENNIGIAVKDGSIANIDNINFRNNNLDIVLFNKKQEFLKPSLICNNLNEINRKKILQSKGTKLVLNSQTFIGNLKDDFINSKIY